MEPTTQAPTVISQQPATGTHLAGSGQTPTIYRTVLHQLMSDGSERYACMHPNNLDCAFVAGNPMSVVSHQRIHRGPARPSPARVRAQRLAVKVSQVARVCDSLADAAEKLNADGIPTLRGGAWTAANVSKVLRAAQKRHDAERQARQIGASATPPQLASTQPAVQALINLRELLTQALREIDNLGTLNLTDPQQMQTLRDKAARFDAIQAAMGGQS